MKTLQLQAVNQAMKKAKQDNEEASNLSPEATKRSSTGANSNSSPRTTKRLS